MSTGPLYRHSSHNDDEVIFTLSQKQPKSKNGSLLKLTRVATEQEVKDEAEKGKFE